MKNYYLLSLLFFVVSIGSVNASVSIQVTGPTSVDFGEDITVTASPNLGGLPMGGPPFYYTIKYEILDNSNAVVKTATKNYSSAGNKSHTFNDVNIGEYTIKTTLNYPFLGGHSATDNYQMNVNISVQASGPTSIYFGESVTISASPNIGNLPLGPPFYYTIKFEVLDNTNSVVKTATNTYGSGGLKTHTFSSIAVGEYTVKTTLNYPFFGGHTATDNYQMEINSLPTRNLVGWATASDANSDGNISEGKNATLDLTVSVFGDELPSGTKVKVDFYWGLSSTLDKNNDYYAGYINSNIENNPGTVNPDSYNLPIPTLSNLGIDPSFDFWIVYLNAEVDPDNQYAETDEGDNIFGVWAFTIYKASFNYNKLGHEDEAQGKELTTVITHNGEVLWEHKNNESITINDLPKNTPLILCYKDLSNGSKVTRKVVFSE